MPASTSIHALPYPVAGDPPAGHTQMQALANAVDGWLPLLATDFGSPAQSVSSASPVAITGASASVTLPTNSLLSIFVVVALTPSATGVARVYFTLTGPSGAIVTNLQVIEAASNSGAQTRAGAGIGSSTGAVSTGGELGLPRVFSSSAGAYTITLQASSAAGTATISTFVVLGHVQVTTP